MPKRVKVTSLPEWETLALINSLINLCKNDHVSGFREVLDQNLQENIKELMGRLWILDICKRTKFKIWRTLIYPNTLDPNHLKLSLEDLDKRVSSAWCNNQNANTRAKCVEMLLKNIVATHETWEKYCLLRATIPNITRQPLQANSSAQDKAPGKHEANALLQLFAQDNKIAHECVNQCLVKFKEDTLDQVLCCLWNLPIYRSERIKLAEWLLREGKMLFRCSLAELNEREIMSDIPKLWVDELNKTKLDTTQKRKIKEQFAIKIMSNRNAQQSATNDYKRPGDPKPPASERPGLFRPTEA